MSQVSIQEKVSLLMEETGCDRGDAELALELSGYEVSEALRALDRRLRNIVMLRGKFVHPGGDRFGLFLMAVNVKARSSLRARAVLSFNPAVYAPSLEEGWFDFEKKIYGFRLWEGSLPPESLEVEKVLSTRLGLLALNAPEKFLEEDCGKLVSESFEALRSLFGAGPLKLHLTREILSVARFKSLDNEGASSAPAGTGPGAAGAARERTRRSFSQGGGPPVSEDMLVLEIGLEEDASGIAAGQLRSGDMVSTVIQDQRDIAQYLGKIFGGFSHGACVPIMAPVEAVEAVPETSQVLTRVRFTVGVCGDAVLSRDSRVKAVRIALRNQEMHSWWRRMLR